MKQGYLTCLSLGRYGRFMNGGYQIAGILGIAKANNLEPVFPPWINYDHRDRFGSTEDIEVFRHFEHQLPAIPDGIEWLPERFVDWGYWNVQLPAGNHNLSGHFQSGRYFDNAMDQVRHYLRMKDEPPQNDYVAVHYRATDYDQTDAGYHPRMTMDYYAPAMNRIGRDSQFLIFSDDIEEAKKLFGKASNISYSEGQDYLADWKLLKRCKSFIISNSSYSAMAALLGEHPEKQVIAPRPWFGRAATIDGEDIYSPDWIVLNWR